MPLVIGPTTEARRDAQADGVEDVGQHHRDDGRRATDGGQHQQALLGRAQTGRHRHPTRASAPSPARWSSRAPPSARTLPGRHCRPARRPRGGIDDRHSRTAVWPELAKPCIAQACTSRQRTGRPERCGGGAEGGHPMAQRVSSNRQERTRVHAWFVNRRRLSVPRRDDRHPACTGVVEALYQRRNRAGQPVETVHRHARRPLSLARASRRTVDRRRPTPDLPLPAIPDVGLTDRDRLQGRA